jgi:hypothetical protein
MQEHNQPLGSTVENAVVRTAEMTPKFAHFGINLRAKGERQMWVCIIEIIKTVNLSIESILFSPGE